MMKYFFKYSINDYIMAPAWRCEDGTIVFLFLICGCSSKTGAPVCTAEKLDSYVPVLKKDYHIY